MCLIIFKWHPSSDEPLVILGNRDEFYQRPSKEAHRWDDMPHVIAGRDLQAGGTWLGVSEKKRLCTVTNFREVPAQLGQRSRGEIPIDFLNSDLPASEYAKQMTEKNPLYSGFNALLYDGEQLVYTSNRSQTPWRILEPGLYGLSNHLLDSPWPKLERAKQLASEILNADAQSGQACSLDLLSIMMDEAKPKDEQLPNTGIGISGERLLSSIFIQSERYGTRTTSLVRIKNEEASLIERNYEVLKQTAQPNYKEQNVRVTWKNSPN